MGRNENEFYFYMEWQILPRNNVSQSRVISKSVPEFLRDLCLNADYQDLTPEPLNQNIWEQRPRVCIFNKQYFNTKKKKKSFKATKRNMVSAIAAYF